MQRMLLRAYEISKLNYEFIRKHMIINSTFSYDVVRFCACMSIMSFAYGTQRILFHIFRFAVSRKNKLFMCRIETRQSNIVM